MKHMTAAPKEIHRCQLWRHTLMIINVECNVKMPEPQVIHAVPWDLKVTLAMVSQCLKCLSYCMMSFCYLLYAMCSDSVVSLATGLWTWKTEESWFSPQQERFFAFSNASKTAMGPPSLLFNCIRGSFPRAKTAGALSWPLTSIWYWD